MITTREYVPADEEDFLMLYRACLEHYQIAPATPEQEARVLTLLNTKKHMSCLMAYDGEKAVGFATWALTLPAGAGVALYMKELFVDECARGRGAGRALLLGLVNRAAAEGCARLDWQTDGKNRLSQSFYEGVGAPGFDKQSYRISADDYESFRKSLTSDCLNL